MASAVAALASAGQVPSKAASPRPADAPDDKAALLQRVWTGVQRAQEHETIEGALIETRTSPLLARPMVLRGRFSVQGTTAFRVEYTEPQAITIVYNSGYINVTMGQRTDVFEAESGVSRAIGYFGKPDSLANLRRDFAVTAEEVQDAYTLRMEPVAGRFKKRTGPIVATFQARDFRITRLEINGRSGVRSVFDIRIERVDVALDPKTFEIYRPSQRRRQQP